MAKRKTSRRAPARMKLTPLADLGAYQDDPDAFVRIAMDELGALPGPLARRRAAELVHLAMTSSVEKAAGRTFTKRSEEIQALKPLERRIPGLLADYNDLRRRLHGECFHQDRCGSDRELHTTFGRAQHLISQIVRVAASNKRRK